MQPGNQLIQLIENLAEQPANKPRVSLYQLTSPQPERMKENEIRLKGHLKTLSEKLRDMSVPSTSADALEERILEASSSWRDGTRLREGLALFAADDMLRQLPLPQCVGDRAYISERFHLKPLFAALQQNRPFYLLALSQNQAALFEGDAVALRRLQPDGSWPRSLESVAGHEPSGKTLHYHAGSRGGDSAIYHGHGAGKDDTGPEIRQFLETVDGALRDLPLAPGAPVILAGVGGLLAAFRRLSDNERLAAEQLEGNVEHLSENALHEQALPLVRKQLEAVRAEALAKVKRADPDAPVARQLGDILRAAIAGRVESVFVAGDAERWGRMDDDGQHFTQHEAWRPGDYDLVDRAAVESHRRGGGVYVVPAAELPGQGLALASLRY
jgi:hypothetical protein